MTISVERFYPAWTLGDRMRKARMTTGMHQRDFAVAINVKSGSLAAWESDRAIPRNIVAVARRIELVSGVPAAWILGLDDGPPPGPPGGGSNQPTDLPERTPRAAHLLQLPIAG